MSTQPQLRALYVGVVSPYARLAKVDVYQHWVPVAVAWAITLPQAADSARGVAVFGLFVLAAFMLAASGAALDDVQGTRDGIDQNTYGGDDALRTIRRKPLLTGEVTDPAAERFGRVLGLAGMACGIAAIAIAPHHPLWLAALFAAGGLLGVQYAYGLKVSYLGGGEVLLALVTAGTVAVPHVLLTGELGWRALLVALLVGCWFAQVTVFSNSADADEDRRHDRRTFATRLSPRANKVYIASWFAFSIALASVGLATGELPPLLALALVPCWAIEVVQLVDGVGRSRWLEARALGWRAFDAGVIAVVATFVVEYRL